MQIMSHTHYTHTFTSTFLNQSTLKIQESLERVESSFWMCSFCMCKNHLKPRWHPCVTRQIHLQDKACNISEFQVCESDPGGRCSFTSHHWGQLENLDLTPWKQIITEHYGYAVSPHLTALKVQHVSSYNQRSVKRSIQCFRSFWQVNKNIYVD